MVHLCSCLIGDDLLSESIDLDHRQCAMEFGLTWPYSIVPLAVNIFIALSNEAYSAEI
jgi:hypothetical protein